MAFPGDWKRKVEVQIQSSEIDATLTNFPVLLTEDCLPSEFFDADGGNSCQADGGDIRVSSDSAGATQLSLSSKMPSSFLTFEFETKANL